MLAVLNVILIALSLYRWIVIAAVIFSWLFAFNVINGRNQFVAMVGDFLHRATEPLLRPIRRFMPDLGGLDISPIILLLGIIFAESFIAYYLWPAAVRAGI